MAQALSEVQIENLGFDWPRYTLIEKHCVTKDGNVDMAGTIESLQSSQAFYQSQINQAYAFKRSNDADYADFTDRHDDNVRMLGELKKSISYVQDILKRAQE